MPRYRKIDTRIWNDEKFRHLDFFAQDLWFYILTNDQTNQVGMYVWRHEHARADLIPRWRNAIEVLIDLVRTITDETVVHDVTIEMITGPDDSNLVRAYHRAWQALISEGMIHYHKPTRVLFVTNFLKYEPPASHLNVIGWKDILSDLPVGHDFFPLLSESLEKFIGASKRNRCAEALANALPYGMQKGMGMPMGKGYRTQEQEQEQEQDLNNNRGKRKRRPKAPHPGKEHLEQLQVLSDHHADLFGRRHVDVQLDDHVKRIVKVLEKYGMEECMLIQEGHHDLNTDDRFSGWEFAFPMVRDGKSKKKTEPKWDWVERYRVAGEKARKRKKEESEWPT